MTLWTPCRLPRLTLFGRSLLLVTSEFLANAICWTVAGILFGRSRETQPILSLALLAWTLGLRHALDADHISAIDNATRGLISMGQLPVTCGLFFSLGHSTIVVVVNVAIAISSDVYEKINGVGTVGGIVGAAVSGSFLFIIGVENSIFLWKAIQQRRKVSVLLRRELTHMPKQMKNPQQDEGVQQDMEVPLEDPKHGHMLMMRILGPVITFVNKPWKMYPVGVLFGFRFDTASSIALLAVSALAKKRSDGTTIPPGDIVILPLLFTAGMAMIDSLDSILMLYSYSGFPEHSFVLFEKQRCLLPLEEAITDSPVVQTSRASSPKFLGNVSTIEAEPQAVSPTLETGNESVLSQRARNMRVKMNMMSGLSIILTLMSILVAFSISLITIMGLIGEICTPCQEAAEAEDGALTGRWWRGWAKVRHVPSAEIMLIIFSFKANDNSGYIGAAIVGAFVLIVAGWYGGRWIIRKNRERLRNLLE
ncbi:NicO-domain-containing protein [Desarmillaria tabescens]|uniref:Nickel/cobalt efflux system n=1 Tax=Armillaria tabescens TaxID=1929756 RepID=A0AA39NFD3_ARMTA|nr:NicO-domain-containing protein [Desarmillaria tabescens]KAK0464438.1 NicO-domain-containing protein [Desarmillaria tabescens]